MPETPPSFSPDESLPPASSYRSLNVWDYKPWWCQPWSIFLTGSGLIMGSWGLAHRFWITLLIALPVLFWMGFFLIWYPTWFRQLLEQEDPTPKIVEQPRD